MADSTQHWFEKNRPPRVQITYDVETGGAIQKRELPADRRHSRRSLGQAGRSAGAAQVA